MRITATGISDVGRVREGNEDAYLVADSVFAVADGMGGHVAGEVAASTALEPIRALDGRVFSDSDAAADALRTAVVEANETVSRMAADEPSYRGMGTTLTAAMLEGQRLHVAHVGDSRAYLLRGGRFSQLTDDHTLVQHLIDEGQITREEAASHPQRSIITRAIGVSPDVDVDSLTFELQPGDAVLLCSDGLTGVVDDLQIAEVLADGADAEAALRRLVRIANDAGGPDNITAVLLRFDDPDADGRPAAPRTVSIRTQDDAVGSDWAGKLGTVGSFGASTSVLRRERVDDEVETAGFGRLVLRALAIVVGIVVLVGLLVAGGRFLLNQTYFIGLEDQEVVIYQGIDVQVGPFDLKRVVERTDIHLDEVPAWYHPTLEAGRPAADINDARRIVQGIPRRDDTS
jgi:PPM family protein phosphatase